MAEQQNAAHVDAVERQRQENEKLATELNHAQAKHKEAQDRIEKMNRDFVETGARLKEAEEKTDLVKKGSKLSAYGITTEALKMKLNKTTEPTEKAKNVVQFRSSFTLSENTLTSAGKKTLYLQIIAPDGQTLQTRGGNTLESENGTVAYSDKKDIDYQNQAVDVTIYYDLRGEGTPKGNYKVKIYCDGTLIGTDSINLK
jgi:hypothetical protein